MYEKKSKNKNEKIEYLNNNIFQQIMTRKKLDLEINKDNLEYKKK